MGAIFLREIQSYFQAITGFIFLGLYLLYAGIVFALSNLWPPGSSDFRPTLAALNFFFLVAVPVLTMRLLSEETRQKTDQLLLTSPVSLTGIVMGKYLAALALFTAALATTAIFPALMGTVGLVVRSELLTAYLGIFLLGACLISVGLFISSLTESPVSAAFLTFGALLFIWMIEWIQQALPSDRASGVAFAGVMAILAAIFVFTATRNWWITVGVGAVGLAATAVVYAVHVSSFDGLIVRTLRWFSLLARYDYFNRSVLAAAPVTYFLSFSALFIFLTVRVIEKRRWA